MKENEKKKCFVIMPFSDPEGYEKGHFDTVYKYLIQPACKNAGFEAERVDQSSNASLIVFDILKKAVEYEMAICDMSAHNPNVFYELGFRHAFGMKTVLIKDDETSYPFDTSGIRTMEYSKTLRVNLMEGSVNNLANALKETEANGDSDGNTPVQLLSLKTALKPEKKEITIDTQLILNELKGLKQQMGINITPVRKSVNTMLLPDNTIVKAGDVLYVKDEDLPFNEQVGSVISVNVDSIAYVDSKGDIKVISYENELWKKLTTKFSSY